MSVVASYAIKGGVGKTTTAVNLAWVAASLGQRVLLWDLDPQGAASYCLRIKAKVSGGAKAVLRKDGQAAQHIRASDHAGLDVLPADPSYRSMEHLLMGMKRPRQRLKEVLGHVVDDYDLIVLDCVPSISLTSENVFRAADLLLVPLIPSPLSMRTMVQLRRYLKENGPKDMRLSCFFSMADSRKRLHKEIIAENLGRRSGLLRTVIPYASDVEMMSVRRAPLPSYAPANRAAQAYQRLWQEVAKFLS
ncbi:MAG: chromosome partitioning protein [Gammaproteobacteria bacterium]|jgi:chromosome partitioning protein